MSFPLEVGKHCFISMRSPGRLPSPHGSPCLGLLGCPLDPLRPKNTPLDQLRWTALKITKGPIKYNSLRGPIKYGCWPHGTPYTSSLTPGTPKTSLLTQKSNQITKGPIGHLDFTTLLPFVLFQSIYTVHFISRTFLGLLVLFKIIEKCRAQALFRYDCSSSKKRGVTQAKNTIRKGRNTASFHFIWGKYQHSRIYFDQPRHCIEWVMNLPRSVGWLT